MLPSARAERNEYTKEISHQESLCAPNAILAAAAGIDVGGRAPQKGREFQQK